MLSLEGKSVECYFHGRNRFLTKVTFGLQAELSAAIPKVGAASSSSASSPAVQELRKLMEQVDTIKAERDAMEQDLKVQQDDMGRYYNMMRS